MSHRSERRLESSLQAIDWHLRFDAHRRQFQVPSYFASRSQSTYPLVFLLPDHHQLFVCPDLVRSLPVDFEILVSYSLPIAPSPSGGLDRERLARSHGRKQDPRPVAPWRAIAM